jgi:hypothetical protein
MKPRRVLVTWDDAGEFGTDNAWMTQKEAIVQAAKAHHLTETYGWLLHKAAYQLVIAQSMMHDDDEKEILYTGLFMVPTGWVRRIRYLK